MTTICPSAPMWRRRVPGEKNDIGKLNAGIEEIIALEQVFQDENARIIAEIEVSA